MTSGLKQLLRGAAAIAAALMLVPQADAAGGTMRYAAVSEPAPLDVMLTTAGVSLVVGMHIFEALYTLDSHFEPQPMLAESEKVEDGGKTIIIKLREGARVLTVAQRPLPFQPALGSSMRPSIHLVKKPIGYGTRSTTH